MQHAEAIWGDSTAAFAATERRFRAVKRQELAARMPATHLNR